MSTIHTRNGIRFNIHAGGVIDGVRYPSFVDPVLQARLGIVEAIEPEPPEGYTPETHVRNELDSTPFVTYEPRPPAEAAALRWAQIRALREGITESGGVLVAGHWFHTDGRSRRQQLERFMLGDALPPGIMWKTLAGDFVELTPALLRELCVAQVVREGDIFALAERKAADTSPINEGWPEVFNANTEQ